MRQGVAGGYAVLDDTLAGASPSDAAGDIVRALGPERPIGFAVGAYDRSRPFVIDPVLVYSTYLGGSVDDRGFGIGLDGAGNAYVTGATASTNFPAFNGNQPIFGGGSLDAFVTKLSASGTVVYSAYLGGSSDEQGFGIVADTSGNAYVAGYTQSSNFPTTVGAFDRTIGQRADPRRWMRSWRSWRQPASLPTRRSWAGIASISPTESPSTAVATPT